MSGDTPSGDRDSDGSPAPPSPWAHPLAEVEPGAVLGAGTRVWRFSHVAAGARIGADCVLGQNVTVGSGVTIGDRCKVQNNVSLYAGVVLEDGVFCGPSCVFTNVATPRAEIDRKAEFKVTRVRRGATIGANATIVCGATLGAWCLIGAGAVVTHDVPPLALMAGVPARRIGWVSHAGEVLGADLVCPRTGDRYAERPEGLRRVINLSGFGEDDLDHEPRPQQASPLQAGNGPSVSVG